ncbi:MAG: universal stress protein [Desulfonatronovibrionaceae bacterium]
MSWYPKNKVLVPVDFSEASMKAVDVGLDFVSDPSGLYVLHVSRELNPNDPAVLWGNMDDNKRVEESKKALREALGEPKYQNIHVETLLGEPGSKIVKYAKGIGAELIIMPSHGRKGFEHMVIGSVAERVLRTAECPVLILRRGK